MTCERELLSCRVRLRRYAHAMCGTCAAGDDVLMATIRRLELSPSTAIDNLPIVIFRLLIKTWNDDDGYRSVGQHQNGTEIDRVRPIDLPQLSQSGSIASNNRLDQLSPTARQAFLLVAQGGFQRNDAAAILDLEPYKFAELYSSAEEIVLRRDSADVLIIEDDAFVSADLGQIMRELGHAIAGIASTCDQAICIAEIHPPGLILCDISLADGSSGIHTVNEILNTSSVPVLFVTSHPGRLSTNAARNTAYIVSKTYSAKQIRTVSSQVLFHKQADLTRYEDNAAA